MPALTHGEFLMLFAIHLSCTGLISLIVGIGVVGTIRRENKALIAALADLRRG